MESLKLFPFHLVEFISKEKKIPGCVDCDCLNWKRYDEKSKKFMAKYIPPPYTEKTKAIFQMMVKQKLDVPDHWTEYNVNLVGHAETYEEAEKMLDALNLKKNVYSSDSDMNSTQKANAVKKLMIEKGSAVINRELNDLPSLKGKIETTRNETKSNLDEDESDSDSETDESDCESIDGSNQSLKRKRNFKYDARKKRNILSLTNSVDDEKLLNAVDGFLNENSNLLQDDPEGAGSKDKQNLEVSNGNSNLLQHNSKGTGSKSKQNFLESMPSKSTGKNSLLVRILKETQGLKHDIREAKNSLLTVTTMVENMAEYKDNLKISLSEQFKLNLPMKELHELEEFDIKLKTEEDCYLAFKASLTLLFDRDGIIRKSLTNIIKKFIARELAMKFTASKKIPGRELFKEFYMCTCIVGVVGQKYSTVEGNVLAHLGTIFTNSKDWDGHRKSRVPEEKTI